MTHFFDPQMDFLRKIVMDVLIQVTLLRLAIGQGLGKDGRTS